MSIKQYNNAGTFSTTLIAQPTSNRVVTIPDTSGTLITTEVYATATIGGTIKMCLKGSTLYITNNGNDACVEENT
jgi:hypothetical protein